MEESKNEKTVVKSGMGFFALLAVGLTILFVALKLTGYIDWAWWQVFLPAIIYVVCSIPCCIVAVLIITALGSVAFVKVLKDRFQK